MNVGLRFITQAQAHGEIGKHAPVIAYECAEVHLMNRKCRYSRGEAELCRASTQASNLPGRVSELAEEQGAAIPLDRTDLLENRLAGRVEHRLVVRIQHRSQTSAERERAVEILRR